MKEGLRFSLWDAERPASSIEVLRIFPYRLDSLAEDVDGIPKPDLVPGIVIIDAVEGRNVCYILVQNVKPVLVVFGVGVFVMPYRPTVLERQGTELADDVLM